MSPFERGQVLLALRQLESMRYLAVEREEVISNAQAHLRGVLTPQSHTLWLLSLGKVQTGPRAGEDDLVSTVKAVRLLINIGLREAKDLCENLPQEIGPVDPGLPTIQELIRINATFEWRSLS